MGHRARYAGANGAQGPLPSGESGTGPVIQGRMGHRARYPGANGAQGPLQGRVGPHGPFSMAVNKPEPAATSDKNEILTKAKNVALICIS